MFCINCDMSGLLDPQTVQERLERVQELSEFTENCKKQLEDIFETLGWSWDETESKLEEMVQCPLDPDHTVPQRNLEKHKASCRLKKMGYSAKDQEEMCDPSFCYENNSIRSFTMDKSTQHQVILQARSAAPLMKMEGVFWQGQFSGEPVDVPQSHKRALCDLTVADRLALYDHVTSVMSNQKEQALSSGNEDLYVDLVKKLQREDGQNEPKTHLELMAEMRDYKRRRQSYRAKNVHITKKSYTEVIREVINVHSGELSKQWRDEEKEEEQDPRSEPSTQRRPLNQSHSPSPESRSRRHRSRSHDREPKKKKKKRERDSRSPDEQHHERKKKKKKKRDEKEK